MGNYGFDLVSWYTLKEWIDTREKMLAIRRDISFDPRTQYMQMYPQPGSDKFYGISFNANDSKNFEGYTFSLKKMTINI